MKDDLRTTEEGAGKLAARYLKVPAKKRILVVDDNPADTHLLKLYLEQTGNYEVREVNDPLGAVAAATEFEPDLILLDVRMPGMGGGEIAARLEAVPKLVAVPIVFLTAAISREEADAVDGRVGGFLFLAKPIVLTEVSACLKRHLGV